MTIPATEITEFHCSAERHFAQFQASKDGTLSLVGGAAALIHGWAYRLSKTSGHKLWVSPAQAAEHLRLKLRTAQRAFEYLKKSGFFVLLRSGKAEGEPSEYQVISHKDWAEAHPGECCEKFDPGWQKEEDPLGVRLYAASNGKCKFKAFQVHRYRTTGIPEEMIVKLFETWLPHHERAILAINEGKRPKRWRKSIGRKFGDRLKDVARVLTEYPGYSTKIMQNALAGLSPDAGILREEMRKHVVN